MKPVVASPIPTGLSPRRETVPSRESNALPASCREETSVTDETQTVFRWQCLAPTVEVRGAPSRFKRGEQAQKERGTFRKPSWHWLWLLVLMVPFLALAGGSGLNTVVVVNQASSNSVALGNYYGERRQVPPQNLLRIVWTGDATTWSPAQFEAVLAEPLRAMLAARGLTNQIDYVALSMDIPYRVSGLNPANSTTSALFYGLKVDEPSSSGCALSSASTNFYALSEAPFRAAGSGTNTHSFLATMLTAYNLQQAKRLVDQGVTSDGSFPTQAVVLAKTTDWARNVRYFEFDNAIFDASLSGRFPIQRTNSNQTYGRTNLFGFQTGLANYVLSPNTFVPGAIADTLTSYAGCLFVPCGGQTMCLDFIAAGATATYGTVTEPCNYLEKFPDPLDYFYQARGFSIAESYYQSLVSPYEGIIVAEPLASPFARPGAGNWTAPASNALLSGTAFLSLEFSAADPARPLQQVDLFVDGMKWRTLTNIPPEESNLLAVTINDVTAQYRVPSNATLQSLASGLAEELNSPAVSNLTRVRAMAIGDRLELNSTDLWRRGSNTAIIISNSPGAASRLTTFATAARPAFLDTIATGWRGLNVAGQATTNDYLRLTLTKTNGEVIIVAATNTTGQLSAVDLAHQIRFAIRDNPALQGADGISAEEWYPDGVTNIWFLLFARAAGWEATQIQIEVESSTNLTISPTNACFLDENLDDLFPRNHLYLTAGATNLAIAAALDTTQLPDGWHEFTAVAYEGTHVRTQTRTTRRVRIQNTSLSATLDSSAPLGVAALADTIQFNVTASTAGIATTELFSTGGSLGVISNQQVAVFAVAGTNLGTGLHPFYAVATSTQGASYRTQAQWVRLSDAPAQPAFPIQITAQPVTISWPGVAGQNYDLLSSDGLTNTFLLRTNLPATSTGFLRWAEPLTNTAQRFYRVRASE